MLSVGSKDQTKSASVSSSRTPPPDNSNIGHSNKDHNLTSLSRSPQWHGETRECIPHSSVGNYYSMPGNEKHATEAQGFSVSSQFLTESKNNSKSCAFDKLSLFKSKVAFEEIACQIGIKVGSVPENSISSVTSPGLHRVAAVVEADGLDACTKQDPQISRFEEMAWLNGIKVGKKKTDRLSASSSESSDSVVPENIQEIEFCTDTYLLEEDPQIARFQESAWLRGIKVSGKLSSVSSSSSLSPATSDDYLIYHPSDEIREVAAQTKGGTFEELVRRNGIKFGKPAVPTETFNVAGVSAENCDCRLHGSTASSVESMERASIVFNHAATQTEVITVDCHSQTCKQSTQVQVDALREAFAEEFMLWKLDESAAGDDVELCYKELYLKEKKTVEELSESLQNEKDVSANTKHNHKRVMEQLKEELSSKSEEIEVIAPFSQKLTSRTIVDRGDWL